MGIQVIFNRPRRPTDNAKVERMQQTTKNWARVNECETIEQLKKQLHFNCRVQRERYKVRRLGNQTRKEAFAQLYTNSNLYKRTDFDIQRAWKRLSQFTFVRQSSKIGQFSLYGKVYYLGSSHAKQKVAIKFCEDLKTWNVFNKQGILIKKFDAKFINKTIIWNLSLCQRT